MPPENYQEKVRDPMLEKTYVADEQQSASSCPPRTLATDQDILIAIADGAVWALDMLYQRYSQGLYSLAYRMVSDHQIAEDLLQETFLRVWRYAATYSAPAGSVHSWLFAILRNYAVDYLRRQRQRTTSKEVPLGDIEFDDRFALADIWEEVWHHEEQAQLREALVRLSEKQRMVLELSFFQGYTHSQIAAMCKMPLGTVKSCMRLGLMALKRELMKSGEQETPC
jgi:RNA polymerase sigma factor (sigma-70 family)